MNVPISTTLNARIATASLDVMSFIILWSEVGELNNLLKKSRRRSNSREKARSLVHDLMIHGGGVGVNPL